MRLRSRILMAKERPLSTCLAYFTFPKLPSPSVRPITYLDRNGGILLYIYIYCFSTLTPSPSTYLDSASIDRSIAQKSSKRRSSESARGGREAIQGSGIYREGSREGEGWRLRRLASLVLRAPLLFGDKVRIKTNMMTISVCPLSLISITEIPSVVLK